MSFPFERPLGATARPGGGVEFRVWAPRPSAVSVLDQPLEPVGFGVWEGVLDAEPGDDYRFVLDRRGHADPMSRSQPRGLRGPSRVVDPDAFEWTDAGWDGVPLDGLVLYELHVGAFTPEGTFDAVIPHLRGLRSLGVNAIELMPVSQFPGERGWGYDGVFLRAPHHSYGGPDGLRRLVDAAHSEGMAVFLDLVLNHIGASGVRTMKAFGPYFTDKYETGWGKAINYDDTECEGVREWALQSAASLVREYHLDGLRLDAVHAIVDDSPRHLLAELADRVHAVDPNTLVIAESNRNDPRTIRPEAEGGLGQDAQWADDFHHALHTLLTGEREGYYRDFGRVEHLARAFDRPFVYDGRWSEARRRRVGAPAGDRPPEQFVVCSQNHDQVGNRAFGDRPPRRARPLAAFCTLLSPFTPMLFMGEEWGENAPFQFFTDHTDKRIATATREGRRKEFADFAAFAGEQVPDPQSPEPFERSKLTRRVDRRLLSLYHDLLDLRPQLPRVEPEIAYDEQARWLRVRRGPFELAMNFASRRRRVPIASPARDAPPATRFPPPSEILLATHDASLEEDHVVLPPLAGAVLR